MTTETITFELSIGGYPLFFITSVRRSRRGALSFDSARENVRQILDSIGTDTNDGWRVRGCDINYEDCALICDHSGKPIAYAYSD